MANSWFSFNKTGLPTNFWPDNMLLLSDGSVLLHQRQEKFWIRLTPDSQGKYETGTWSQPLPMLNQRAAFASGILRDGKAFVIGGEYSDDLANNRPDGSNGSGYGAPGNMSPLGEIFDPLTNTWSPMNKPPSFNWILGDAPSCVLPDGRVLLGSAIENRAAIWTPETDDWREVGTNFGTTAVTKSVRPAEETWTLLPDGTVLTATKITPSLPYYPARPSAEKYIPSLDRWIVADQATPTLSVPLVLLNLPNPASPGNNIGIQEIGPALVLPDGRLFAIGATGHTALYHMPATPTDPGYWTAGPDFPLDNSGQHYNAINSDLMTAIDAPAVLLPCGKVLCVAGPTVISGATAVSSPSVFLLYDPSSNSIAPLNPQPPNVASSTMFDSLLLLPTGQVMLTMGWSKDIFMLTPDTALLGTPQASWKPTVTNCPNKVSPNTTITIQGTQFNGLSQACSFGDESSGATNYPIVRMTNIVTKQVSYLHSYNFSTLTIQTGSTIVSTQVDIPALSFGQYCLEVIANGIASDCVNINVTNAQRDVPHLHDVIAEAVKILFGVIHDEGGYVIKGGHIIRIPPRGPALELLQSLASYTTAGSISKNSLEEKTAIQKACLRSIEKLAHAELVKIEARQTKKSKS